MTSLFPQSEQLPRASVRQRVLAEVRRGNCRSTDIAMVLGITDAQAVSALQSLAVSGDIVHLANGRGGARRNRYRAGVWMVPRPKVAS